MRRTPLLIAFLATAMPSFAQAQTPRVYYGCYVPGSGTVYRIKEPNTPDSCHGSHVQFSWTDGASADHGGLTGLADDDHKQYLLTDGVRAATSGFIVTGTPGVGALAVSGAGTRLMWYPKKAAFRAGQVIGTEWDDANIGDQSVALGFRNTASGSQSVAIGSASTASSFNTIALGTLAVASAPGSMALGGTASGNGALALGVTSNASGGNATAIGPGAKASGLQATAIGAFVEASGQWSTAMGRGANTNSQQGSFVYADATGGLLSTTPNQFLVRAAGGTIFYSSAGFASGVSLPAGGGAWATISDVNRKENFRDLDGDEALAKIASMPIREWNYKSQDDSIRHVGPTAQDFYGAFRLGESDLTITTSDISGINMLGIQTLARRTATLDRENQALRSDIASLEAELADLRLELAKLRAVALTRRTGRR
jgi:hypothetical protein